VVVSLGFLLKDQKNLLYSLSPCLASNNNTTELSCSCTTLSPSTIEKPGSRLHPNFDKNVNAPMTLVFYEFMAVSISFEQVV